MVNLYESGNFDKSVEEVVSGKWYVTAEIETLAVIIPRIGIGVTYRDKEYEILATTTFQENSGESFGALEYPKADITTKCQLIRIDDEGVDMGEEPIWVNSDEITFI